MLISVIIFIAMTTFVGFNIIVFIDRYNMLNAPEKIGLSYLFGLAAISLEMFVLGLFKINFSIIYILLPWVFFLLLNIIRHKEVMILPKKTFEVPFNTFEKVLAALLSFEIIYTFFRALMKPIEAYDSVSIWALKAKILYFAKTIPGDFFKMLGANFHGVHPDYPLLLPFSEVWFYTSLNSFNDYLVKIIFPMSFLAFLLIFYSLLKRITQNRQAALLFTFILASVKQFNDYATNGLADLQMAIYTFLTFVFLFIWAKYKKPAHLAISVISCVFAFWTKNEGSVTLLITVILLAGLFFTSRHDSMQRMRESRSIIFAIIALLLVFSLWFGFKAKMHIGSDVINRETLRTLKLSTVFKRFIPIGYEYQKHIFGFKKWNIVWILFLYMAARNFKKLFLKDNLYIMAPLAGILCAYTAFYLITPYDISWHLSKSASRLLIHILPLAVFFMALNVNIDKRGSQHV